MLAAGILSVCLVGFASAQLDAFALPSAQRYASKPTVPAEFSNYFELDGHARELVDSLLGPRGGFFPEKAFEIGEPQIQAASGNQGAHKISNLERRLESFFTAPENPSGQSLPPGFGTGFALANNNKALTQFGDIRRSPTKQDDAEVVEGSGDGKSSIAGIPNIFPKLPKPPTERLEPVRTISVQGDSIGMPVIETAPSVPEGGFLPTSDVRRSPASVSEVSHSIDAKGDDLNTEEYGGLSEDSGSSGGGLIGTIFNLIKLGGKKAKDAPTNGTLPAAGDQKNTIGQAVSNLLGGANSPLPKPGSNILTDLLYKTLSRGSLESNETTLAQSSNGSIVLTPAQSAAISSNLEMIQDLIIKPSSPLCTQKPDPVEFELDPLMGQWYQVIYSPPVSTGPCSMVSYKKLSDNGEETGSIIDVYEYTTDGTPYGKPIISSGYALVKGKGELIFRTNSNKDDVTVHILNVGPLNHQGEYEYVVMSTNCNYPVYVFARDTSIFKQKYEPIVNEYLDKSGVVNGISRLLNVVAPVDNTMCIFPPHLFYNQGR